MKKITKVYFTALVIFTFASIINAQVKVVDTCDTNIRICTITKYDSTLKEIKGNYKLNSKYSYTYLNDSLRIYIKKRMKPIKFINEINELAKVEFSIMDELLTYACKNLEFTREVVDLQKTIYTKAKSLKWINIEIVDSSNALNEMSRYTSVLSTYSLSKSKNIICSLELYFGEYEGKSISISQNGKILLKYFLIDILFNKAQYLRFNEDLFLTLKLNDGLKSYEESKYMSANKKFIKQ